MGDPKSTLHAGFRIKFSFNNECFECIVTCILKVILEPPGGELYTQIASRLGTAVARGIVWKAGTYVIPILGQATSIYSGIKSIRCIAVCAEL